MSPRTQRRPADALDDDEDYDEDYDDGSLVASPRAPGRRRYHTRSQSHREPPEGPSSSPAGRATLPNDRRGDGAARPPASKTRGFAYRHGADNITPFAAQHQRHGPSSSAATAAAGSNPPTTPERGSPPAYPPRLANPPLPLPCLYCLQTRKSHHDLKTKFEAFTSALRDSLAEAAAAARRNNNSRVVAECRCSGHAAAGGGDGMVGMDWQYEATTLVRYAERRPSHVLRQLLAVGVSSGASLVAENIYSIFNTGAGKLISRTNSGTRDRSLEGLLAAGLAATQSAPPWTTLGISLSAAAPGQMQPDGVETLDHSDMESVA